MNATQNEIIEALQTTPEIDPKQEIERRVHFLKEYAKKAGVKGFVLGISGGQDSTLAGKLAQMAVDELETEQAVPFKFVALRLPYGQQHDEDDAAKALDYIEPQETYTIDVQPGVDASVQAFERALGTTMSDFIKGNTKARERMKAQYDVAGAEGLLVLGTDHAAEAVTGFYTKHGDGACDVAPLFGLNKRQGKMLLRELEAPASTFEKVPTADLESDRPGLPDEEALGLTYDQIDDFLEGRSIDPDAHERLVGMYNRTAHKRELPATLYDTWWKE